MVFFNHQDEQKFSDRKVVKSMGEWLDALLKWWKRWL